MFDGGIVCCDFFGGSVYIFYQLIQWLFELFDDICLFVLYDYWFGGCDYCNEIIVGDQKWDNIYVGGGCFEDDFVMLCIECDVIFGLFDLIIFLVQINVCVGYILFVDDNGWCYIKVFLNYLEGFFQIVYDEVLLV